MQDSACRWFTVKKRGYTKVCNHPQSPTTIHNHLKTHPQPSTTTHNHPQLPTTFQHHPQLPKKPPTTIHIYQQLSPTIHNYPKNDPKNDPQPSTTTQKLLKKAKTCHKQWCYSTLDVHTETDVEFW